MSDALNTAFFLPFGKRGVDRSAAEAALIQDLLCYERTFVLTDQMDAVGRLVVTMGWPAFSSAVIRGAIRFVHDRHIIAWPKQTGRSGVVPFLATASVPQPGRGAGFSQTPVGDLAANSIRSLNVPARERKQVIDIIDSTTLDFGMPEESKEPSETPPFVDGIINRLKVFEDALSRMPGTPLKPADLIRLRQELRNPDKSPLRQTTFNVMKVEAKTGEGLMSPEETLSPKQLVMLNLALSDRFLEIHARTLPSATLHTEPAVEQVLAARLSELRRSAGSEVDVVLDAERVHLPVLKTDGQFPYLSLLRARESASAGKFRSVVERRDGEASATLIQEYMAELNQTLEGRVSTSIVRLVLASIAGVLNPVAGLASGIFDSLAVGKVLGRREARYFIDDTLRRMSSTNGKATRKK